jgi:hypothetical protein
MFEAFFISTSHDGCAQGGQVQRMWFTNRNHMDGVLDAGIRKNRFGTLGSRMVTTG